MPIATFAGNVSLQFVDPGIIWPAPPQTPAENQAYGPYGPSGPDLRPFTCPLVNGPMIPACYQDYTVDAGVSYSNSYYIGTILGSFGSFRFSGWSRLTFTTSGTTVRSQCLSLWNGVPQFLDGGPVLFPAENTTPYLGAVNFGLITYPGDANYPAMTVDSVNLPNGPFGTSFLFDDAALNTAWFAAISAMYVGVPKIIAPITATSGGFVVALQGRHYFVEANWRRYWATNVPAGEWPTLIYDPANGWWFANGVYSQFSTDWIASNPPLLLASPITPANTPQSYGPSIGPPPGVLNGGGLFPFYKGLIAGPAAGPQIRSLGSNSLGRCCNLTGGGLTAQAMFPTSAGTR